MSKLKTLRFEELQENHIPAILEIESQVNSSPWSERAFRNELAHEHRVFLTALLGTQIVGYGGAWLVIDEAHITNVAVDPEHQKEGIGTRLMVEILKRCKDKEMVCSTLEVRAGNEAAIKLYEKLGYILTAKRKQYYPDNNEDAIIMWLHHLDQWEPPKK